LICGGTVWGRWGGRGEGVSDFPEKGWSLEKLEKRKGKKGGSFGRRVRKTRTRSYSVCKRGRGMLGKLILTVKRGDEGARVK